MPRALVIAVILVGCTGTPQQYLTSPCVGMAATQPGDACPPCTTDSDCQILSNLCEASAFCVNKTSNWTTSPLTCSTSAQYLPNTTPCGCTHAICVAKSQ
jgi:hypothetical protein